MRLPLPAAPQAMAAGVGGLLGLEVDEQSAQQVGAGQIHAVRLCQPGKTELGSQVRRPSAGVEVAVVNQVAAVPKPAGGEHLARLAGCVRRRRVHLLEAVDALDREQDVMRLATLGDPGQQRLRQRGGRVDGDRQAIEQPEDRVGGLGQQQAVGGERHLLADPGPADRLQALDQRRMQQGLAAGELEETRLEDASRLRQVPSQVLDPHGPRWELGRQRAAVLAAEVAVVDQVGFEGPGEDASGGELITHDRPSLAAVAHGRKPHSGESGRGKVRDAVPGGTIRPRAT